MTLLVISSLCLTLFLLMPLMLQPLSLGLCIMLLTTFFCLLAGVSATSWYSYILFLVFVGGLLVMFAYVSVLAPNTFFISTKPMIWLSFSFFSTLVFLYFMMTQYSWNISQPSKIPATSLKMSLTGVDLVMTNSTSIMAILGTVLLLALLAVVKICFFQQGPLRPHS